MRLQSNLSSYLKETYAWVVYANFWIAGMAIAGLWQYSSWLKVALPFSTYLLVFAATFSLYNLDRIIEQHTIATQNDPRKTWITHKSTVIRTLTGLAILLAAIGLWQQKPGVQLAFMAMSMLAISYSIFFSSRWSPKTPAWFMAFKPMVVALVWTGITVGIPCSMGAVHKPLCWPLAAAHFTFILALTLPFEWRDRKKDADNQVSGWANWLSRQQFILLILCLLSLHLLLLNQSLTISIPHLLLFGLLAGGILYGSIWFDKPWFYALAVDGMIGAEAWILS